MKDALAHGRNANDNFPDEESDHYGTDEQDVDEMQERNDIKGGSGQHGKGRNANDNFNEDD